MIANFDWYSKLQNDVYIPNDDIYDDRASIVFTFCISKK